MAVKTTYRSIKLEDLDTTLSVFRLIRPVQISSMARSFERLGQLHPVIVRKYENAYQLIDGFKRYYAAEQLCIAELQAYVLDITESAGKAMILNYNRASNSLVNYEEAMVVYSLKKDHLLNQKEIASLLGCSTSWVCRRLSLKERLEESVQSQLRFGKITSAHAKEIVKLQRCNQNPVTSSIIDNNVTSRQSAILVELYLKSGSKKEHDYLLRCPVEAIENSIRDKSVYDCRLGRHGNRLLRTIELLSIQQHIFTGQFNNHQTLQLTGTELHILTPKLKRLSEKSNTIYLLINKKTLEQ
jgi:ParB/RepB/Spo0J family partition protein